MARTQLTIPTTFYVDVVHGSDTNNGLALGSAWQTINHAQAVIASDYDLGGIAGHGLKLADGTYPETVVWWQTLVGQRDVFSIIGNLALPSNVVVDSACGPCFTFAYGGRAYLAGMQLQSFKTSGGADLVGVGADGFCAVNSLWAGGTGPAGFAFDVSDNGVLEFVVGGIAIVGSEGQGFITAGAGGGVVFENDAGGAPGVQIYIAQSLAYSAAFICAQDAGRVQMIDVPITAAPGSTVNAKAYQLKSRGMLDTGGYGMALPGAAAGVNLDGTGAYL
jgi:hypothetical protein